MTAKAGGEGAARRRGPLATALLSLAVTALEGALLALALGGVGALLRHPRALALIGCWAVAGLALAFLRPERSREAVEVARESRWTLMALGLLPFFLPALAAWDERAGVWALPLGSAVRWSGVALSALGLALRIAAMAKLRSRFSPWLSIQPGHQLETGGVYRILRHPGYAGAWLASLGVALAFGSGLALLPLAVFGALLVTRARREEALMERHFGEAWAAYRSRTLA